MTDSLGRDLPPGVTYDARGTQEFIDGIIKGRRERDAQAMRTAAAIALGSAAWYAYRALPRETPRTGKHRKH